MGDPRGNDSTNQYPPVGDPDRYDMIVQRGRALRRRRLYARGAGAGGTVAALVVAVLLVSGGGNSGDDVVADLAEGPTPTTESTTTSTTTTVPLDRVSAIIDNGTEAVTVTDPVQPVDVDSQQCVLFTLETADGDPVAEGYGCDDYGAEDTVVVELVASDVAIGCAMSATTVDPAAVAAAGTAPADATFNYVLPTDLAPGEYSLTASVTSGVGDGCAGSQDGSTEVETSWDTTEQLTLP